MATKPVFEDGDPGAEIRRKLNELGDYFDEVSADVERAVQAADDAEGFRDEAQGFAGSASSSASAAAGSALAAANSAGIASVKAGEAEASANTASTKASEALASAQAAQEAADILADPAVQEVIEHIEDIQAVNANAANINAVAGNETNINAVNANKPNIDAVAGNKTNIDTVAGIAADVSTVAGIDDDVSAVAGAAADVSTVATNISDVQAAAADMAAIKAAPGAASTASSAASTATTKAGEAEASALAAAGSASTASTKASEASGHADRAEQAAEDADDILQQVLAHGNGWTPVMAMVSDGERRVVQITDWTGGQGTKPATGYLGATGVVSDIAQAIDVRGAPGSGSVSSVNSIDPDGSGNVSLGISDIPGLEDALDNAGQVKTVAGKGPDGAGNVELGTSDITGLDGALENKVDKVTGYGLSQENYTLSEKQKLASLESSRWKGEFVSLGALQSAYPTAEPGDYADVDAGAGQNVRRYIWDDSDGEWVEQSGVVPPLTAAQVKTLYESNPDTNGFTDALKSKLENLAAVATSGSYNDLSNKPSIPAAQVNSDWNATSGIARILNKPLAMSQGEAETGTATTPRLITSEVLKAAIDKHGGGGGASIFYLDYEDRGNLRTTVSAGGAMIFVESLGLFLYHEGSSEPEDDETCFATSTGRWLLECPHWDFVEAWREPDRDLQERRIDGAEESAEDALEQANAAESSAIAIQDALTTFQSKFIRSSITSSITSVAREAQATFSGTVAGADVGDLVVVTPPNNSGSYRISFYARVTATNTVSVYINNHSTLSASLTPGAWQILVVKQ